MDVVETVMRGRHRKKAGATAAPDCHHRFSWSRLEGEPLMEVGHEIGHAIARGRQMSADLDVLLLPSPPFAGRHNKAVVVTDNRQHLYCCAIIKGAVKIADEFYRCRIRQHPCRLSLVDLLLNTIVGDGFDLEVAPIVLGLNSLQGLLDLTWPGVVAFDQITIVGVHDPDGAGQLGCGFRMEGPAKSFGPGDNLKRKVQQFAAGMLDTRRFDAGRCFLDSHFGRYPVSLYHLYIWDFCRFTITFGRSFGRCCREYYSPVIKT